jgi:hypothetical protein
MRKKIPLERGDPENSHNQPLPQDTSYIFKVWSLKTKFKMSQS